MLQLVGKIVKKNDVLLVLSEKISFHQGGNILLRHLYCHLKACGVRGKNTENLIVELASKVSDYQGKRYVIMKFAHNEKHIVFLDIGKGRKRMEVFDEIKVIIAMN